jgi:tetratricopeptide (TPR) repeat protein
MPSTRRSGTAARSPAPWLAIAAALALALSAGCTRQEPLVIDTGTRAVVIGIDGADWKIIEEIAAEGGMPNLMALRERGTWGEIETLHDIPLSPVIWTSMATGKTPDKHGITWFMVDQPDGTRVPVRSTNRRTKAIWNILAEHGRRPGVVGWWATYPAEDVGSGWMVSDALGFHGFGATARRGDDRRKTHPPALFDRVAPLVPPEEAIGYDFVGRFVHLSAEEYQREMYTPARYEIHDPHNPIHLFQQYAATAMGYTAIAEKLLAEESFDLLKVYFEQVDSFSHLFIKYAPPRLPWVDDEGFERYRSVVRRWYEHQDELLGRLLERIDLDTTAVIVVSDHGFKSGERRIRSEETVDVARAHLDHEPFGVLVAAGPHIQSGARIERAHVLDLAPTLLHYLGFPVGRDMDGRVLEELFDEGFQARFPVRTVESFEGEDPPAVEPLGPVAEVDPREAEAQMEALRSLGYLGAVPRRGEAPTAGHRETSPEMHLNLARIFLSRGELDRARQEFEAALALDPGQAEALLGVGQILGIQGRTAEAEQTLRRALRVDPASPSALAHLAELRRDQGNLDDAIRLYREALDVAPPQPFVYIGLGDVLQRAARFEEAAESLHRALELDPDSFQAHYNLGVTYGNSGRAELAVRHYQQALELAPQHPEAAKALNNLGVIALGEGRVEEASEWFERAVAAGPFHLESRFNLAMQRLTAGSNEEVVRLLEEAAELDPNHEVVHSQLGLAYLRAGRNEDAYRSLLMVRRLYPDNWIAPFGLAVLHAGVGQSDEARRHVEEALRLGGAEARERIAAQPLLRALAR